MISLADQIAELEREKRLRLKVYPNHISRGMLKESDARWRVSIYASPAPLDKSRDADSAPEERK
jgi:hypothetical protein